MLRAQTSAWPLCFNRQLEMDNVLREVRDEITDVEFRIKWNDGTSTENYTEYRE